MQTAAQSRWARLPDTALRYSRAQDHDGSHIKGLIINFLDHFFPGLLQIPGFLVEFITPIVKVTKGKKSMAFFTIPEYEGWKQTSDDGRGWHIKYYKVSPADAMPLWQLA